MLSFVRIWRRGDLSPQPSFLPPVVLCTSTSKRNRQGGRGPACRKALVVARIQRQSHFRLPNYRYRISPPFSCGVNSMKTVAGVGLKDVQAVYSGPEGELWELVMGQQIHIGGLRSSMDAGREGRHRPGDEGRRPVLLQRGGDAVSRPLPQRRRRCTASKPRRPSSREGRCRSEAEGLAERITFVLADVCHTGLPADGADFVWGEDAWCYVVDKPRLMAEAARLVKPGGTIAFTDWVEGPPGLSGGRGRSGSSSS